MSDDEGSLALGPPPPEPVKVVRADALERADRAWTHRVAGHTWRECAQVAGFASDKSAMDAVRNAYGSVPVIDRDLLRAVWRDRLEATWRQVTADMSDRVPGATTAAVRIVTAAAALDGLNEPYKVDVEVVEGFDALLRGLTDEGYLR